MHFRHAFRKWNAKLIIVQAELTQIKELSQELWALADHLEEEFQSRDQPSIALPCSPHSNSLHYWSASEGMIS